MKLLSTIVLTGALIPFSTGCATSYRDVSHNLLFARGYRVGDSFILQKDVVLIRDDRNYSRIGTPFSLFDPYAYGPESALPAVEKYSPGAKAVGVVSKGTHIRIVKLVAARINLLPFYFEDMILPVARIMDGDAAGKNVEFSSVSSKEVDETIQAEIATPSPKYLQRARAGAAPP